MLNTPIWEPPKWRDPVTKQGFCVSFFLVLGGWDYCFVLPSADLWVQWVLQQQWLVSGIGGCPSHFETKLFLVIDPFLLAKCHLEAAVVGPNQNQDVKGYKAKALFTSRLEVVLNIWIDFIGRLSTHAYLDYWRFTKQLRLALGLLAARSDHEQPNWHHWQPSLEGYPVGPVSCR